jgi:hypothetical protein
MNESNEIVIRSAIMISLSLGDCVIFYLSFCKRELLERINPNTATQYISDLTRMTNLLVPWSKCLFKLTTHNDVSQQKTGRVSLGKCVEYIAVVEL